ncbi:MAG: beta-lactamase family protein, partial [Deltaproteobacteria bacterium]|nr:beta-lactamase family protein [Deltaproteobacteria bacterium]
MVEIQTLLLNSIEDLRSKTGVPGVSAAISLSTGDTITAATGFADVERKIPLTRDTRLLGGSTGKTFATVTALTLVQQGRLNLDTPISTWLGDKDWFTRLPNAPDLTLRSL